MIKLKWFLRGRSLRSKILRPKHFSGSGNLDIKAEIDQEGVLRPNGKLAIEAEKTERRS